MRRRTTFVSLGLLAACIVCTPAFAAATKPVGPTTHPAAGPGALPVVKPEPSGRLEKLLAGDVPASVDDLKAMEQRFREVAAKVTPATVGISSRGGGGSGVIISADGYVLTVGHVTREAGRDVTVLLPDGRRLRAKTLGADLGVDAGLVQILDKPPGKDGWPHCEMGRSEDLKPGQWLLAAGHPGGFQRGRTPPVRIGRVLRNAPTMIVTGCTIVSGDSGGPLFDMDGKVVGISSRISGPLDGNIHVPVDAFRRDWGRLAKGEVFGFRGGGASVAYFGVMPDPASSELRIGTVVTGSAAEKAGARTGDVVKEFDGKPVPDWLTLVRRITERKPGDKVAVTVLRDGKTVKLNVVLGRREQ